MNFKARILSSMVFTVLAASVTVVVLLANMSISELENTIQNESQRDLIAKREAITSKIESYFTRVEKQMLTLSDNLQTENAAVAFTSAFNQYAAERQDLLMSDVNGSLRRYYSAEFGQKFKKLNSQDVAVAPLYNGLSQTAQLLQYDFISNNPSSLGEKDELVTPQGSTTYRDVHAKYHQDFQLFLKEFGYYDIFIVDAETGNIVYSVFKELDYATSLMTGPYRDSGIAEAFNKAKSLSGNETYISDFAPYLPSYNGAASFIGSPIVVNGRTKAVLIFQMPLEEINNVMTHDNDWLAKGFGESGETYLVGTDKTLRNESRFFIEDTDNYLNIIKNKYPDQGALIETQGTSIGIQPVGGLATEQALKGNRGFTILNDYRDVPVLSAYGPIHYGEHTWAILSEVDEEEAYRSIEELSRQIWLSATTVISFLAIVTLILAYWLAVKLTKPIVDLGNEVDQLNSGEADLSSTLKDSGISEIDHVSQGINRFTATLKVTTDAIKGSSETIASSSTQLSATTVQTNNAAYSQQEKSQEITEALKQFYHAIEEVASNSVNASNQTTLARNITEENSDRANLAKDNISQLVNEVTRSSETLGHLQDRVNSINDVLNVITSIAEQTNLLALNAAIEAARAGEHGRGFAVVADEVRQLATRTQQSTVEIQQNIGSLTSVAGDAVESMERASISAEGGIHLVDAVSSSLDELLEGIKDLDNINQTVASASEEQKYTCDSIMQSMQDVEQSASELFIASKEVASASSNLSSIANDLQGEVERFK